MHSASHLDENYAGAFGGRLQSGKSPALLVVDLVVAYAESSSPLFCETAPAAIEVNRRLISCARKSGPAGHLYQCRI